MTNIFVLFLAFVFLANPIIIKAMEQLVKNDAPKKTNSLLTGKKPFQCTLCPKSFTQPYKLRDHGRIHTGEKPFQCLQCPKSFRLNQILKGHIKTHTKPFQCTLCPLAFARSSTLTNHTRTHTGEKPFQCLQCSKSFAIHNSLKRHINNIHIPEALSSETNYQPATNNRTPQSIPDMSCNNYLFLTNDFDENSLKKHPITTDKNLPQQEFADLFAHQSDFFEREYITWLNESNY